MEILVHYGPKLTRPLLVWLCNSPVLTGHSKCSYTSKWPALLDERCRSQSLSQVNHSIDPVPGHHQWSWCGHQTAWQSMPEASGHSKHSITEVTDLELPYANFAKLTAFRIVAQFPLVTKLAKRRKPYYCFRIQPEEQADHRKSSMHKYRHALTMSIIFHPMKIICRSTRI